MPEKGNNAGPRFQETVVLDSEAKQCAPFREKLRALLIKAAFDDKTAGGIVLAADEALTNIIRHAYGGKSGRVEIDVRDFSDRMEITFRDHGQKFDPTQLPEPELPPTKGGGLGVYFMKQLMDKVEYDGKGPGNRLVLTKFKK